MSTSIQIGQAVPFFSANDIDNNLITSQNQLGHYYILYFYPKNDTPGCTTEACNFRDSKLEFDKLNVKVYGISPDDLSSHQAFHKKHELNFTLIPDSNHKLCELFGVWKEKNNFGKVYLGVERSTFIVDPAGRICWFERQVKVDGHVQNLINQLNILKQAPEAK